MPWQKLAAQPSLRLRVANFVEKFQNVGTNSRARRTRGNRVLVANVDVVMMIVDANFAVNKVTIMLNMTVTLFKVKAAPYANVTFALLRVWVRHSVGHIWQPCFMTSQARTNIRTNKTILRISVYRTNIRLFGYSFDP